MPTLVYLVHGMGCGAAANGGASWSADVKQAMTSIQKAFGFAELEWMDPIPDKVPKGSEKKTWVIPVSYYDAFDQFRAGAQDRAAALKDIAGGALSDARIADLAREPFLWNNCLDVLLWWSDKAQARPQATAAINTAITRADALARKLNDKTRRIVVAHSLGTAATTYALRYLAGSGPWQVTGGIDAFVTLANVAPFLIDEDDVYSPPLLPWGERRLVQSFVNVRQELDPIPWLLPWRRHEAAHALAWAPDWATAEATGLAGLVTSLGVVAPPGGKPEITHVHGFANYLLARQVAPLIAGMIRGARYTAAEQQTIDWPAQWAKLPQLACPDTVAMTQLRAEMRAFSAFAAPGGGRPEGGWFERLLSGAEMLMAAKKACP
ncbi:MAG: hypothetical protein ACYC7F_01105 [Gemmatimonadaceae bacterium]